MILRNGINQLLKRIKFKLLNKIYKDIEVLQEKSDENIALTHILSLNPKTYLPVTGWSLRPSVLNRILNDIIINKRTNIIEFGAGISTVFMALLVKRNKLSTKITTVESDDEWVSIVEALLAQNECLDYVVFIRSKITSINEFNSLTKNPLWYDLESLKDINRQNNLYDLVVVDGPQGDTCSCSRFPAIPFIKNNLSNSYSIFLDDAKRHDERLIASQWTGILGVKHSIYSNAFLFSKNSRFYTDSFYDSIK